MSVALRLLVLAVTLLVASARGRTTEFGRCSEPPSRRPAPVRSCRLEGRALPCASRRSAVTVRLPGDCAVTCVRVVDELAGGGASAAVTVGGGVVSAWCAVVDVAAPARLGFRFRVDVHSNCTGVAGVGVAYRQTLTSTCCCY